METPDMNFGTPGQMKIDGLENLLKKPEKPVYVLNAGQQEAFDWLVPFCIRKREDDFRRALLEGYAGTGKTFCLNRIVERVRQLSPGINFGMTAPTHKAVRQLKKHSELPSGELDFGTIHSFLGLKQKIDEYTGVVSYVPDYSSEYGRRIDGINVLIVDEASMLDDDLYEHIQDELNSNHKLVVIYTGDPLQIPPVGKKQRTGVALSKPFMESVQKSHKIKRLTLTEPQRQAADSPIIMYAHAIRRNNTSQRIGFDFTDDLKHALELVPPKDNKQGILDIFKRYFDTPEFLEDADYVKVVAWRNKTVDYFNSEIRKLIYKRESLPMLLEEERVIMDAPFVKNDKVVIPNNEEVIVTGLKESTYDYKYKLPSGNTFENTDIVDPLADVSREGHTIQFKTYTCNLLIPDNTSCNVKILHEDSLEVYKELREAFVKAAKQATDSFLRKEMWKQFYAIEGKFAWVKYNYCLTGHKSQGSTYDYCISMEWDIDQNWDVEERNRIKYVAASRARHKLFIIK